MGLISSISKKKRNKTANIILLTEKAITAEYDCIKITPTSLLFMLKQFSIFFVLFTFTPFTLAFICWQILIKLK